MIKKLLKVLWAIISELKTSSKNGANILAPIAEKLSFLPNQTVDKVKQS